MSLSYNIQFKYFYYEVKVLEISRHHNRTNNGDYNQNISSTPSDFTESDTDTCKIQNKASALDLALLHLHTIQTDQKGQTNTEKKLPPEE